MNISKDVKDIGTCVVSVLLVPPPIPSRTILASLRMDWDWILDWKCLGRSCNTRLAVYGLGVNGGETELPAL